MRPLAAVRVFAARRVGAGEWGRLLGPAPLPGSAAHGPRGGLLALSRALLLRSPFPRLSHPRGQPPAGSAELQKPPLRLMSGLGPGGDLYWRWGRREGASKAVEKRDAGSSDPPPPRTCRTARRGGAARTVDPRASTADVRAQTRAPARATATLTGLHKESPQGRTGERRAAWLRGPPCRPWT